MKDFIYYAPTQVVFGALSEDKTGKLVKQYGGTKVLVHYGGQSAERSGLLDKICRALEAEGIAYVKLGGVVPNPRLSKVHEGIELCRKEKVDFILAVGGGSVIDSAKAIAFGVPYEGEVWDFYMGRAHAEACLPVATVLTIPAAGSEMSNSTVITNEDGDLKKGYSNNLCRCKFAVMNPERTYTLPNYQTACGVTDIMMHTMERYFVNIETMEITDSISESLMQTVIYNARILLNEPGNYNARAEIMWAGSLSHNGITGLGAEKDFAVHQLGHELSAKFDIAHGASLSAVWGAWAAYVYDAKPSRFAQYARRVWNVEEADDVKAAQEGIRKTVTYFASLDMPTSFCEAKEIGSKTDEEVKQMAHGCSYEGTRTIGSFKVCDENDIYEIYKLANK